MHYNGDATDINATKTAELLESAAIQGHKGEKENIGRRYMQLIKFDEASKWLEKNAANGDESAYYLLAEVYCELEKFDKAKVWAQKSIDSGNEDAAALYKKHKLDKY